MNYIEVTAKIAGEAEILSDLLIQELGEIGFESFEQSNGELKAYIKEDIFSEDALHAINSELLNSLGTWTFTWSLIEQKNWNETWEKNFQPVEVNEECILRAPFHKLEKDYKYDIVIEPKMSFGTGHHETTRLMMTEMLKLNVVNKSVVDCGCGTGVLAILAHMLGADAVYSFDNDEWAVENALENYQRNKCPEIPCDLGGIDLLNGKSFDIILANINRNILLDNMHYFAHAVTQGGIIFFSGIYSIDVKYLNEKAMEYGLTYNAENSLGNWSVCSFTKK